MKEVNLAFKVQRRDSLFEARLKRSLENSLNQFNFYKMDLDRAELFTGRTNSTERFVKIFIPKKLKYLRRFSEDKPIPFFRESDTREAVYMRHYFLYLRVLKNIYKFTSNLFCIDFKKRKILPFTDNQSFQPKANGERFAKALLRLRIMHDYSLFYFSAGFGGALARSFRNWVLLHDNNFRKNLKIRYLQWRKNQQYSNKQRQLRKYDRKHHPQAITLHKAQKSQEILFRDETKLTNTETKLI